MSIRLNDDDAKKLYALVEVSREKHKNEFLSRAKDNLNQYLGNQWRSGDPDEAWINEFEGPDGFKHVTVNYSAAGIEIKGDAQTYQRPAFDAELEGHENDDPILPLAISERVTQDFMEGGAWDAHQAALLDAHIFGVGCTMDGWREGEEESRSREAEAELEERRQAQAEMAEQMIELAQMEGIDPAGLPDLEPDELESVPVVGEGPTCARISPFDLIVPADVDSFNYAEGPYMGFIHAKPLNEVRETLEREGVKHERIQKLKGNADPSSAGVHLQMDPEAKKRPKNAEHPYLILIEVWFRNVYLKNGYTDDRTGEHYPKGFYPLRVIWESSDTKEPLFVEPWPIVLRTPSGRRRYPFRVKFGRRVPGSFYSLGEMDISRDQQKELNHWRSALSTIIDLAARVKYQTMKGNLDADALETWKSRAVGELAETALNAPISRVDPPQLPAGVEIAAEHAVQDMNVITGVSDAAKGVPIQGNKTATEANLITQMSSSRQAKDNEEFESDLVYTAQNFWQMVCDKKLVGNPVKVVPPRDFAPQQPSVPGMDAGPMDPFTPPEMQGAPMAGAPPAQPSPVMVPMNEEQLVPAKIKIITGSTRMGSRQEKVQNLQLFIGLMAQSGLLATPQNPVGIVNCRPLIEELASVLLASVDFKKLYDTSEFQQIVAQQQQAQMQQMLMQGLAGAGNGNGRKAP